MRYAVLMLAGLVVLAGCKTTQEKMAEAGNEPTMGREVTALVADTTLYGTTDEGVRYQVYRTADGGMRGKASGSFGTDRDTGSWSVTDAGLYCATWRTWQEGRKRCWRVYDSGDAFAYAGESGGATDMRVTKDDIVPGNPENL